MDLVIVESPAKAKTIEKWLDGSATVLASYGHVRDLPARDGSVDPDKGFAMHWEVPDARSREQVARIVKAAKTADRVILATDPDREGEAISWHLAELLAARKAVPPGGIARITFNAITREAVTRAMAAPRPLDQPLVDAYLARRALDYLFGFTLSPVLWRKLPGARSAGRVQSVALRLIVEREAEIEAFVARAYWTVEAALRHAGTGFVARLVAMDGARLDKFALDSQAAAEAARLRVEQARFEVASVERREVQRHPAPPFTTSTLQQEAARKLGLGAQATMRLAQALYEAGHISYMRTDGVAMDAGAIAAARDMAMEGFGPDFVPDAPRRYAARAKNAQEAHEAIRPVDFRRTARTLGTDAQAARLYELIWKRAVASQMASARQERTSVELASADGQLLLRAVGTVTLFPGFLALYAEGADEAAPADAAEEGDGRLPRLDVGDRPACEAVTATGHETQPPPRYSEAGLVKRLEELGIGRPSTYASIIEVLKARDYVRLEAKRFVPEDKGRLVTAFLERFFPRYVDYHFTAGLEEDLDRVSAGDADWQALMAAFWADFRPITQKVLEAKPWEVDQAIDAHLGPHLFPQRADGRDPRACPACADGRLALRVGRYGPFISCSNYPQCTFRRGVAANGSDGPLGTDPETGLVVEVKDGRYGRYVQSGERRSSIPSGWEPLDLERALKLLALPRHVGDHPETGKPIEAGIGRYGPFLRHDGHYAKLKDVDELFGIGMNAAVVKLAAPKDRRPAAAAEPIAVLGADPGSGQPVRLMPGRFGPYVTDGTDNASLPKGADPAAVTLDDALALLARRREAAGKGGARKPAGAAAKAKPAKPKTAKPAALKTAKPAAPAGARPAGARPARAKPAKPAAGRA